MLADRLDYVVGVDPHGDSHALAVVDLEVAKRIDHNRACLSVARKRCRRAHHILRELGDDALAPTAEPPTRRLVDAAARPDRRALAHHHTDPLRPAPALLPPPTPPAPVGLHRPSGRNNPRDQHPINHLVAGHDPRTQTSLGARAHQHPPTQRPCT
jgi:hypothetical protein